MTKFKTLALVSVAFMAMSGVALAAGSGTSSGGTDTGMTKPSPKKLNCKRGQMAKKVAGKMVCRAKKAGLISDDEIYEQAQALAKEGEYDWALGLLALAANPDDPRILNYTGYSHRKAGRLETAVTFYRKALAINPNYVLAREYLGEGYVVAGRIDLAKVELNEIANRCGVDCSEYQELNKAIQTAIN